MNLQAYRGNEPFIFASYAHRDERLVEPIFSRILKDGYRFWFDAGIDPGTEWDENIAAHIKNCGYLIAFISKNWKLALAPIALMLVLFVFVPALNEGTVGIMVPVSALFTIATGRILYKRGVL